MNQILIFLTTSQATYVAAAIIFFCALCSYFFWFIPAKKEIIENLKKLSLVIDDSSKGWLALRDQELASAQIKSPVLDAWLETKSRTIKLFNEKREEYMMYGIPRDLWNAHGLLARRFNLGLAEAAPNILVGVGLFFTFLFLALALLEATSALTSSSSSKETEEAISKLLQVAGSKFWTSLAGLFSSIGWTIFFRRSLNEINKVCEDFLKKLAEVITPAAGEAVAMQQLFLVGKKLEANNDSNDLIQEILTEAREQTGTFKRFETDLAVSLAGAINQAFTPQMQAMTERLVTSIEGLSDKLGTMNQEALKTMLADFAAMLKQATDSEMTQLQQTLQELTNQLHGAGSALETQSGLAANAILNAGVEIQAQLKGAGDTLGTQTAEIAEIIKDAGVQLAASSQNISEKLVQGAAELEHAVSSIRLGFEDLGAVVENASTAGRKGIAQVHTVLEEADFTVMQLSKTSTELVEASQSLAETGALVTNIVDNVQELAREQRAVVLSVKEVAPNAMAAVSRVTDVLDQAAVQTLSSMQQTRQAMETTAVTLGKTVASITEGVSVYSTQVAELHRQMDGQLARAVGSFDQGVKDLGEVVEELIENIQSKNTTSRG